VSNPCSEFDRFGRNSRPGENRGKCTQRMAVLTIVAIQPSSTPIYYKQSGPGVWERIVDHSLTESAFRAWLYIFLFLCLQWLKQWRLRSVLEWSYKLDVSIWVTYYGFACHLQVVVDLNRESCILEHTTWRLQLLKGVLLLTLLEHGLHTSINPWDYKWAL